MDDKEQEEGEENDSENLRELILQQLANVDSSDCSTDESYKVRLSCILEDDESESSLTAAQRDYFPKDERTKESEKGPPEALESFIGVQLGDSLYDSELSDEFACENVQITDLDDVTLEDLIKEKTDEYPSEEANDEFEKNQGFAIKKLKSSDNVHKRPFVIRRRELSSDSSDLDISISEGPSSDLKIVEMKEPDDEATLNVVPDYTESEEEPEPKMMKVEKLEQIEKPEIINLPEIKKKEDKKDQPEKAGVKVDEIPEKPKDLKTQEIKKEEDKKDKEMDKQQETKPTEQKGAEGQVDVEFKKEDDIKDKKMEIVEVKKIDDKKDKKVKTSEVKKEIDHKDEKPEISVVTKADDKKDQKVEVSKVDKEDNKRDQKVAISKVDKEDDKTDQKVAVSEVKKIDDKKMEILDSKKEEQKSTEDYTAQKAENLEVAKAEKDRKQKKKESKKDKSVKKEVEDVKAPEAAKLDNRKEHQEIEKIEDKKDREKSGELEVVDNETLASIFAKVSRTYLEKTKSNVKWEENERIEKVFKEMAEEKVKKKGKEHQPVDQLSFSEMHIRGTFPQEYDPPVPPETYLWEELKRLRERGGYPWTYLDKPPFDEATWKKYMEHVYEPINPPPLSMERRPESSREVTAAKGSSIPETEKQTVRTPSEPDLGKKEQMEKSKSLEAMEVEAITSAKEIQDDMESRFFTQTPTATSATTASQSRTDITSSVLDTSGFEDLPVKPASLVKTRREQVRAQAHEIQQRLRNHAGRIRDKFNSMPRPNIKRKDRPKREATEEKSRFRLPEIHAPKISLPEMHAPKINFPEMHTPKISLPDRSKFKFPEKAKFHLPDSSKFHLPDRSKFHLPEKGKFHLPERPKLNLAERAKIHFADRPKLNLAERAKIHFPERAKIHLPERGKFRLPDKSKFHLPDKSKFHLPDKSKFHLPERAKIHLPDTSKFHLPDKAKFNLPSKPKIELPSFKKASGEGQTSPKSLRSRFDFELKTPKLFMKHSKDYTTSSPKQTRGRTPPPRMIQEEAPVQGSSKWTQKLNELQYADDEMDEAGARETDSRKSESLFEKEGYVEEFEKMPQKGRTLSTKSSESRLSDKDLQSSESLNYRKKGVLEEINPDEFFLRQKGISQDDIDMGNYLSREIREAFRSPDINALAKMDYIDDENIDPQSEPKRPKRTGSIKKKSILKKTSTSDPSISEDGYKTYPPRRPGRKSRSQSKSLLNEEAIIGESAPRYEEAPVNISRYDNTEYDEDNISEYYKTPGPPIEYQHYKVPRSHAPVEPSPSMKRRASEEEEMSHKRIHESWDEEEFQMREPPKPMTRRKHKKKVPSELESTGEERIPQEVMKELEEVVPAPQVLDSPVPPKRTRTRSSGSRSLRSLVTEDEVSRSFHSEPPIERLEELEDEMLMEERQLVEETPFTQSALDFMPPGRSYEVTDLDDVGFGYATVGKPTVVKPERHKKPKPERPPPPRKKREISMPIYNTYPRRTPVRPLRNYSTVGPSRPPRQRKIPPIERALSERQFRTYAEIKPRPMEESHDMIEVSGSSKDLQTEKVIEKMKGRPLPPPPRPPRQKSKGPEDELEPTEEEKLSLSILRDEEFPLERKVLAFVHEPPPEKEVVEEICVSTQTDPVQEDFSFETEESDMIQEFSHEQLRIQQEFLEEMKREEEEMRQRGKVNENDMVNAELKAEVIRQIEDIIAEEKRILEERKSGERVSKEESVKKESEPKEQKRSHLNVDDDMGYASLERHRRRPEPAAQEVAPSIPSKVEKLQVKELEVESLNVHEVQSDQIFVKELQGNRIASSDIDNRGGSIALGTVDLPPSVIDQIVAKIPWETLKQTQEANIAQPPVRPQRRPRGSHQQDSDEESPIQPRKTHRRHLRPQYSSDEEDRRSSERTRRLEERRARVSETRIPELGLQLARACTSAGVLAVKNFVQANANLARNLDREMCVQAVLCIAIALVAGFFLFGFDAKIIHVNRWDFQFPPQPPNAGP